LLADGGRRNPGPWVKHSAVVAETARAKVERHPGLDPETAYILGLLRDIGRSAGGPRVPDVRHLLDGYDLMLARSFDDSARICLTHSFPIKQADAFASRWVCPPEQKEFVQEYLDRAEYNALVALVLATGLRISAGAELPYADHEPVPGVVDSVDKRRRRLASRAVLTG
jgi:hypothetical protein